MARASQVLAFATSKPIVAGLALVTHSILHRDEWDNSFHAVLGVWAAAVSGLATAEYVFNPDVHSVGSAVRIATVTAVIYLGILVMSALIHRVFFHRLQTVVSHRLPGVNFD